MKSKIMPFFFALMTSVLLLGCRTIQTIPLQQTQNNTAIITSENKEREKDSIYIEKVVFVKGDTVYVEKKKTVDRWRVRTHTDTFLVEKTDSILVPVPLEKTVYKESQITGWSLALNAILLLGIVWLIRRRRL